MINSPLTGQRFRRHYLIASATLFTTVTCALAQPGSKSQIDMKVRVFGSADPWTDTLHIVGASSGEPIVVEVQEFIYRDVGYGFSTCINTIIGSPFNASLGDAVTIIDRADGTEHPNGRMGNFSFGAQHQVVYHTGTEGVDANRFRIAARNNAHNDPQGGISIKQNAPVNMGTTFDPSDGVAVYHFALSLARYGDTPRTVTIDAPLELIGGFSFDRSFRVYMTPESGTPTNAFASLIPTDPATVTVSWAPAPGTLPFVAGVAAWRMKRKRSGLLHHVHEHIESALELVHRRREAEAEVRVLR